MCPGKKILRVAVLLLSGALPSSAAELDLMPWPSQITQQQGFLHLDHLPQFEITGGDQRVRDAVTRFTQHLSTRTGVPYSLRDAGSSEGPHFAIRCNSRGLATQALGEDEGYHLQIDTGKIELDAANPLGIMHGLETLLQLVQAGPQGWVVPAIRIDDTPRFPWRGLMIDVSRHFMPVDALKRNIDGMAAVKLNVLHLHLSDDEGFRVESRRAPKLTGLASDGLFYTQGQVKDLVAYARDRGIRVVPEFDVPGHAVSWLIAYPALASAPAPSRLVRNMHDDVRPPLDPTNEATYKLLNTVFGEMAGLFPDEYFHIGGDEVDGKYWNKNERIQAWMHAHNLQDNHALQAYFNKRVQLIVHKHGKHMEGWDEILDPNLPRETLIQSWRGPKTLADASRMGFQTLLSAGYYLDLMYPASMHYAVDPLSGESAALTSEEKAHIIGGEAAQWTEYVTPEILDNRLWPRLGAIAERLWSPASINDVDSMYRRLAILSRNLEWLDLQHIRNSRMMIGRIAGDDTPPDLLDTLAAAVEPVKEYEREKTQVYDVDAPLNHLVDAIPPESNGAREINALAKKAIHDPSLRPQLRNLLIQWRDNDKQLSPFLMASVLREPLVPLSHNLSVLGSLALEALDAIESGSPVTQDQKKQQLAKLEDCAAPHAEMFFVITPAVHSLIEAEPGIQ